MTGQNLPTGLAEAAKNAAQAHLDEVAAGRKAFEANLVFSAAAQLPPRHFYCYTLDRIAKVALRGRSMWHDVSLPREMVALANNDGILTPPQDADEDTPFSFIPLIPNRGDRRRSPLSKQGSKRIEIALWVGAFAEEGPLSVIGLAEATRLVDSGQVVDPRQLNEARRAAVLASIPPEFE
jgi:hypothetical protein